jgi:hypothetical protein
VSAEKGGQERYPISRIAFTMLGYTVVSHTIMGYLPRLLIYIYIYIYTNICHGENYTRATHTYPTDER